MSNVYVAILIDWVEVPNEGTNVRVRVIVSALVNITFLYLSIHSAREYSVSVRFRTQPLKKDGPNLCRRCN
jgi:hypothetical protein